MMPNYEAAARAIVTAGWANETDGHVDSPVGHFAIVDLTTERTIIADILAEDDLTLEGLPPAWYIVSEDDQGNVAVLQYDTEAEARRAFDYLAGRYSEWADDVEPHL